MLCQTHGGVVEVVTVLGVVSGNSMHAQEERARRRRRLTSCSLTVMLVSAIAFVASSMLPCERAVRERAGR